MKTFLTLLVGLLFGIASVQAQWVAQQVPANTGGIGNFDIINSNVVWAQSSGTAPSYSQNILRTTDGGTTWSTVLINLPGLNGQFSLNTLEALDANTVFAVIAVITPGANPPSRVIKTTDAGQTWTMIPGVYTSPNSIADFVQFFDMNNGLIFGRNQEIYTTNDGGNTWARVPATNLPPNAAHLDASVNLRSVVGNTIWVPVNGMRIYKSTDKGLNWTVQYPNISIPVFLDNLAFQDANNGLANQANNLIRTIDGGQTWMTVNYTGKFLGRGLSPIPGTPGRYISFSNISNYSGMSISNDNGLTWTQLDNNVYYSAAFLNNQLGWSGGIGIIYKTGANILSNPKGPDIINKFTISPNPSTGIFSISNPSVKSFRIEVYDLTGKKILQQQSKKFGTTTVDLTGHLKGLYLMRIYSNGQITNHKVIVQ